MRHEVTQAWGGVKASTLTASRGCGWGSAVYTHTQDKKLLSHIPTYPALLQEFEFV